MLNALFEGRDDNGVIAQFAAGAERGIANIRAAGRRSEQGRAGSNAVAALVDREKLELPLISENSTYWFGTNDKKEGLYLRAYFNSTVPNELIKPFQSQGL